MSGRLLVALKATRGSTLVEKSKKNINSAIPSCSKQFLAFTYRMKKTPMNARYFVKYWPKKSDIWLRTDLRRRLEIQQDFIMLYPEGRKCVRPSGGTEVVGALGWLWGRFWGTYGIICYFRILTLRRPPML